MFENGNTYKTLYEGDIAIQPLSVTGPQVADTYTTKEKLWEHGVVRYMFKDDEYLDEASGSMVSEPLFTDQDKHTIQQALKHISDKVPCLQFR